MKHEPHISKALVTGFCKNCNTTFYRDGDLMSFSSAYASPLYAPPTDIEHVKTYQEWLYFAGNYCDECLPPMPDIVKEDIKLENERRQEDIANYRIMRNIYATPGHEPKNLPFSDTEPEIETMLDRRHKDEPNNSNERTAIQREGDIREKIGRKIPNALHIGRRNSKG